jgi:hypothetical protein
MYCRLYSRSVEEGVRNCPVVVDQEDDDEAGDDAEHRDTQQQAPGIYFNFVSNFKDSVPQDLKGLCH